MFERLGQRFHLGLHGAPCIGRQLVTKTFSGRVSAVRGRERVIDPDVAQFREGCDERGIVFLFARVKTGVLEAEDVAGLHRGDRVFGRLANTVVGELYTPLDDASHFGGDWPQGLLWISLLRPAEMRK